MVLMFSFLEFSGILLWIALACILVSVFFFGKKWYMGLGLHIFALADFKNAVENLLGELPHKVRKETVSDVITTLVWRITRIGFFAMLLTCIPIFLLYQQNELLKSQNNIVDIQTKIMQSQSNKLSKINRPLLQAEVSKHDPSYLKFKSYNAPAKIDSVLLELTGVPEDLKDLLSTFSYKEVYSADGIIALPYESSGHEDSVLIHIPNMTDSISIEIMFKRDFVIYYSDIDGEGTYNERGRDYYVVEDSIWTSSWTNYLYNKYH